MEPGTPLVVQSDGVQGQHTIVIRLMQEPSGANGQTQYMPISVQAIPLYPMAQQSQQLAVDQQPATRNPNYTARTTQRQSRSRPVRQPVQAYCCECSTKDLPVPPGRSNGNRRCRQVCYKVEYMLCPEDAIYGCQQSANPCPCNQFSDVRGSNQFCTDDQDSQAEQDFNYPMGNIPRKCKFQEVTCHCKKPPSPQEQEETKTMPNQSEDLATKDDLSAQYNAPRSQENTDNDDQMEQKTEDAYRRDQSTNTNTQECPTAPDLEYIKTICESLGHAMVACATAAVEAGRSASNWVTRESSYFLEQTPDTTETYERPLISRSWVDTQPSIMTQHINPQLVIGPEEATTDAEAAPSVQINTAENNVVENPEENPNEESAYTLRSIQQQLEVQASEFGIRHPSAKGESKITPDDVASLTQDTAKSTRSSVGSRKSARTPRVSTQSTRSSASAAKRKILSKKKSPRGSASAADEKKSPRGSVSASEQKCIERCSNQSAAAERKSSSASATKRRSSRSGSVAATNEKKSPRVSVNATDEKKSPRGSASATDEKQSPRGSTSSTDKKKSPQVSVSDTERKSSSRDSIKSNKSSGIAAEQKSSSRGSATASERHCSSARCSVRSATASVADRKDSPPGSMRSTKSSGNATEQKTSPRESIRSGKSTASAKERKDSPPGSIHSIRYAEEQKDSTRDSIKSGKSTASAAERKESPPGSMHSKKSSGNAAEQKDSPRGSATASVRTCSPRCSYQSALPLASAAEEKSSPPGSSHSMRSTASEAEENNSPSGSANTKERKIPSRAQASKKVSSVGKLGAKRSPKSGPQSSQPMAKSNKRTTKEPNKRTSSKEISKKRRASSSSGKDNCKNKEAKWKPSTSSVGNAQNRPSLKPLKCCVPCKYINYCYCCPPKPSANNCRPWFC